MNGNCGACNKQVKGTESHSGLQCNLCQLWFHAKCTDAGKPLYDFLNSQAGQNSSVHWYCRSCEKGSSKLFEQMVLVDKRLTSVEAKLAEISVKVDGLASNPISSQSVDNVSSVETQLADISAKVDELASKPVRSQSIDNVTIDVIAKELNERESRAKNVVISGNASKEKVESFLQKVGTPSKNVKQIGKPEKNTFLVEFSSQADKWRVIGKAKAACAGVADFSGMYVNPDLTRAERDAHYKLRQECRARRQKGENVKIKRGTIISIE